MSLLNSASLVVTPNAYKEGTLYSVIPNTTLGDMTVVRATTATRVNSAGLIELVPYNLLERSQEFDNGTFWGVSQATISANATVAPDGTNTADKLIESNANGIHEVYTNAPYTLIAGSNYTKSVFAKSAERTQIALNFVTGGFGQGSSVIANLSTGTLGTVTNYGGVTGSTATIINVGNGWYRISITITPASTANFYADFSTALSGNTTYLGNGTSGLFIWGAQLVVGSLAKDYFSTTTRLNVPRLDYSNGTCPSILVEPQRTNLNFPSIPTQSGNGTLVQNAIISPDGTINANSFVPISNGFIYANAIVTTVQSYTFSLYLKGTVNGQKVRLTGDSQGSLATLTLTTEWVRYSVTFTGVSGNQNFYILSGGYLSPSENNLFYFWGWQIEAGSYATSYIPTTSAAVTRNADAIYKTGISALIGQTEGVVFADFVCVNNSSYCDVVSIGTDGTTGVIEIQIDGAASNTLRATYYYGGFVANIPALATLTIGQRYKAAFAYKTNDFVFYLNGVQQGTDTSGTVVSGMSEVSLNGYGSSTNNKENALINSAVLFPTRLTNAELSQLTTI
jgi:hypothetical protein